MNAALIAACAANAVRRQSNTNTNYFPVKAELTYKVAFRKYYDFKELTIVTPDHESTCCPLFAPVTTMWLRPVKLPARTFAVEQVFYVSSTNCPNGIDRYITDNYDFFTASDKWQDYDNTTFERYAKELSRKYNVTATKGSLLFDTKFHWEVSL